jgi:alpha-tubulin suppressor-like RCC1 family protein
MVSRGRSAGVVPVFLVLFICLLPGAATGAQPAVDGGMYHTVALNGDGTVWAWGHNECGQLGDGTTTDRSTPVQVKGPGGVGFLTGVAAVAVGGNHTVALKDDGTVWAWGDNYYGQLGDGTTTNRHTPVQAKGPGGAGFLSAVAAVTGGMWHTIALKSDGTVWTFGYNEYGQLGDGTTTSRSTPVQVTGPGGAGFLAGVSAVAGGVFFTIALKSDGTVWAWGRNPYGQLGDGTVTDRNTPVQVTGPGGVGFLSGVAAVAGGENHTIALKSNGTVWAWGRNQDGQLGDGTTTDRSTPVQVKGPGGAGFLSGVAAVAGGHWHTIAVKPDGTAWAWGNNDGTFGDGTAMDRNTPVQVKGPGGTGFLTEVASVAGGMSHTIALKSDGTVWASGWNYYGQLGDGTTTHSYSPVQVKGPGGTGFLNLGSCDIYEYYLPYWLSNGDYWTGVGLKNGSATGTALVDVSGIDAGGSVVDWQVKTILPRGQTAFMMKQGEGWVKVTARQPLTGLAFVAETGGEALMFDMTLIPESSKVLHVPHVAQDATWDTIVYVCNPNDSETYFYLTFVLPGGSVVTSKKYTLPANGSGKYPLSAVLGGGSYTSGSVEITAAQGVAAFALYHNLKTGDRRSYAGISAVKP